MPYFDLIITKAVAFLKAETQRSYLGILWFVLEPALYVVIFFLVFGLGFRKGDYGFVLFLMTGLACWKWFQACVMSSNRVLLAHKHLLNMVYVPKYVFPAAMLVANTIKSMFLYGILVVVLAFSGSLSVESFMPLLLLIVIQAVFTFGFMCFIAAVVPLLPDLQTLINSAMTMLFFMSGIFFDIREFSPEVQEILLWNPMASLILTYRIVLLEGGVPSADFFLKLTLFSAVFLLIGLGTLIKLDKYYPRILD